MLLMIQFDPDQRLGREERIHKRTEFQAIYQKGAKLHTPFFVLYFVKGSSPHHRLGMTVSRKIGGAVVRNRVKRVFREIFRRNKPLGPVRLDLVLNAKRAAALAPMAELELEYRQALGRALEETVEK